MPILGSMLSRYYYNLYSSKSPIHLKNYSNNRLDFRASSMLVFRPRNPNIINGFISLVSLNSVPNYNQGNSLDDDEDDDLCPVECVKEFYTDEEFMKILEKSKETNALIVVDFYRTSCGSCKYIEQGFSKLCKASGEDDVPVIFLKHNVIDEYDERSEVADRLRIKTVPLFHFYKNGILLESFATRDKERITEAVYRHMSSPTPQESTN